MKTITLTKEQEERLRKVFADAKGAAWERYEKAFDNQSKNTAFQEAQIFAEYYYLHNALFAQLNEQEEQK